MLAEIQMVTSMVDIEKKTNHSLRVIGETRMFEVGVPERIIDQHLDTLSQQQQAVSVT